VLEITTLFWDLGGVVLSNAWDREIRRLAVDKFHLDWEEFEERHELLLHGFETGEVTLDQYLQRTVFYRERPFPEQEFRDYMFSQSKPYPEGLELLAEVAGKRRYLLATLNNESAELNDYRIATFHLRDYFSAFFSSCYLGVRKPDAGIYHQAIRITQRRPEECLFLDDRSLNLECAREMGMHTIHFKSSAQARKQLREFGVDVAAT
jgi:putative hydrolase of the HAD superfamily